MPHSPESSTLIKHIKSLTKIGIALSAESSMDNFFDLIMQEAICYTGCDGATLYIVSDDCNYLDFQLVYNKSLKLNMGGKHGKISWPSLPLYLAGGGKQLSNMVTNVFHEAQAVVFADVYEQDRFDSSGTKRIDKQNSYRSKSMAAIPLKDHEDNVLGVIQLINATDEAGLIIPFSDSHIEMLTSLASQTAISLSHKKLIADLEILIRDFTHAIAIAIDRKSLHTSGHLTRVAVLTEMFAQEINDCTKGKYADTKFSDNEFREISMAAWMHDFGKIITPQFILDKSKKLETINDRIEIVKLRFRLVEQVLQKDLLLAKQADDTDKIKKIEHILITLPDYLAYIKKINFGGEFLDREALELLDRISKFRYFSEKVSYHLISENEHKNLAIARGTLLPEEIVKIREHATTTMEMLDSLHFPKKYKNVPLYAQSHHEKLNGKGYPLHLSAKEIPLQARILAIADIYEALTASDRPYKKGKKLSETIKILAYLVKDKEIDRELLEIFLDSELYIKYADKYMKPEQMDAVDKNLIKEIYKNIETD